MSLLNENENPIVKRIAVLCKMSLCSPALIGSGEDEYTDRDVYVDFEGNPIIPGTTLAGVLRNTLSSVDADVLFGKLINSSEDSKVNKTSPLWVFDAPLWRGETKENAEIITIDNVSLDENQRNVPEHKRTQSPELDHMHKVAVSGGKFDFQAVERGSCFDLRLQLIIRKNDTKCKDGQMPIYLLEKVFDSLLEKLNVLYVGGKTSRGFGKLECSEIYKKVFENTPEWLENWIGFDWHDEEKLGLKSFKIIPPKLPDNNGTICATLELDGTLLIRDDYSVIGDEDAAHITSDGLPVIYGTSWAGAIRSGLARFLKTHKYNRCEAYLDEVFGCSKDDDTKASMIRIDASYFESDKRHSFTRVKIDRWTGGATKRALFTTCPQFGGTVKLNIHYPAGDDAIRQLFILSLQAIDLGIITVGGETSIGRGKFKVKEICINGEGKDKKALFKEEKPQLKLKLSPEPEGGATHG